MSNELKKTIAKISTADKVQDQINELKAERDKDLSTINDRYMEAVDKMDEINAALTEAEKAMDADKYAAAVAEKNNMLTKLSMFNSRKENIESHELVSEEESDAVIDSLLDYEEKMEKAFHNDAAALLDSMNELLSMYSDEVVKTEAALRRWTGIVHANYIDRHNHGRRSDHAIPVRYIPYKGSDFYKKLDQFLRSLDY